MSSYRPIIAALLCFVAPAAAEQVVFSEVMYNPPAGKPEYLEIRNLTSNRFDFAEWRITGGIEFTAPDFNPGSPDAHFLKEYERVVISAATEAATRAAYPSIPAAVRVYGPWTGQLDNGGDHLRLEDATGARQCEFTYSDGGKWPVAADGAGHSLVVINEDRNLDDWRNWKASRRNGGSPGLPELLAAEETVAGADYVILGSTTVFDYNQVWRWKAADVNPGTAWIAPAFDDSTWGTGKGILGYKPATALTQFIRLPGMDSNGLPGQGGPDETEGLRTLLPKFINGTSAPQYMVYQFRTSFNYSGPLTGVSYAIEQALDDGALYYLNGIRLGGGQRLADATAVINLARGGTPAPVASQTTTSGAQTAALGNDGIITNFTQTLNTDAAPAWTVNLNRTAAIRSISIHNRESGFRERLRDITITILEGTTVLHTSPLLNPANALGGPADLIYDVMAANGGQPLLGRSVRINRTPDPTGGTDPDDKSVLSLAEVQVTGTEAWNRSATTAVGNPVEELSNTTGLQGSIPADTVNGGSALKAGNNVLAVEVHQSSVADTDLAFAARMRITKPSAAGTVVINEVKPGSAQGQGFVEFYNSTASPVDLQNYYLSDSEANLTKYRIPAPLVVPATGLATVDFVTASLTAASPMTIILTQPDGYTPQTGFRSVNLPFDGRSIGRKPEGGLEWRLFAQPTPGTPNSSSTAGTPLLLSELHFGANGHVNWVEFANPSGSAAAGAGLFVASNTDWSDKVALPATTPANGYSSIDLDLVPDGSGDITLYLIDAQNNVLSASRLARRPGLDSVQRHPLTANEWYNATSSTRDTANNPATHNEIVINEVMFSLPSSHEEGQFVELYNRGAGPVNLTGWRLVDGVNFDFPPGTTLAAGQYLVVAKNPAYMTANYSGITNLYGPFSGRLRGGGEMVRLEDERNNLAGYVDYKQGGQWPKESGGEGSSMELINPDMDTSRPSSWRASDESNKTTFQAYTHTGTYKQLRGAPTAVTGYRELMLNLVSDGHVVLRNVSLTRALNPTKNQLVGGDATSHGTGTGVGGFLCVGTHCTSDTLADGFHMISVGSGDTKANKVEVDVIDIVANDVLTLSFEGRWISGMPLMVAQTWDRSFGKVFRFPIPNNLGTPGAVNSRFIAASLPTVDHMRHAPTVPTATQPVVVSAAVSSAAALSSVSLIERIDNINANGTWNTLPMNDSGTGGDAVAGDGIWSATVAARPLTTITQFYIRATAANGQSNECPRSGATRPGMWIVANPPASNPGILTERYVISLFDRNTLNASVGFSNTGGRDWDHPRMSNFGLNSTIILGEKDVFYNSELRRGGSPWTRTSGNTLDRARWRTPGDNQFRNRVKTGIDNDATGLSRFHNRMARYMMYLFGYPSPDSEFVQQIVNADGARIGDNQEQTDTDFFDRAHGSGGELFEIDDAWYMFDTNNMDDRISADSVTGRWFLTDWTNAAAGANPSDESPIYFHGNWPIRFPEVTYDYGALSSHIKVAYNNNQVVTAATDAVFRQKILQSIDLDRSAIYAAVRGYIGDWDNFTLNRGKNGYFYRRPSDGKFEFHHWDSDLAFQNTGEAWLGSTGGIGWTNYSQRPWFRQRYNMYLHQLIGKYTLNSARMDAWLRNMSYQVANTHPLAPFKTHLFSYPAWFKNRMLNGLNFIGGANYTRPFSITTPNNQTVATPLFTMAGEVASTVAAVDIVDHPEAVLSWVPVATTPAGVWNLSGIALAAGVNNLTVRAIDLNGTVLATLPFTVTLSVGAPPVVRLVADPASLNLAANELIFLDGTTSFDPDDPTYPRDPDVPYNPATDVLTYAWSITPTAGATIAHSVPGMTEARFTIPGIYTVSLTVTDPSLSSANITREIIVSNANDFEPFANGDPLGPQFTVENLELRDNYSPSAWYSLEDNTGRLEIYVLDDVAKPLNNPTYTHPLITRDLPDSSDFTLQTDMAPGTREFGNFSAGLWLETTESGTPTKYAFSVTGGTALTVQQAIGGSPWTQIATSAFAGEDATLRIVRTGVALAFQRRVNGVWNSVHTLNMPAGSTAGRGGVFVATALATTVRMSFDYLLVTDPTNTNNVLTNLRITEIMYNPAGTGGIEFIELTNIGTQPVNLAGVYFEEGRPFARFTFPNYTLAPGAFVIVTNVAPAAFVAAYPSVAIGSVFQWTTGSLNNAGERITLRDPLDNIIHDFSFDDDPDTGWPAGADGGGFSLEVVSTGGNYDSASNWTTSPETGGSPGGPGAGPDSDHDGYSDSVEQIAGTSPSDGKSFFNVIGQRVPAGQKVTWPSYPGRTYHVETSPTGNPGTWVRRASIPHPSGNPAGTGEYTITNPAPANSPRQQYRVVVEMTP